MSTSTHISTDQRSAEEAAHWLINIDDDEADLADFAAWLQASPRHVEEFLLISAVWRAADSLDDSRRIDIEQLVAQARDNVERLGEASLTTVPKVGVRHRMRTVLRSRLAAVASLVAIVSAVWIGFQDTSLHYRTAVGEQRVIKLLDGSIVTLNTRSQIKVSLQKQQRSVELISGEALFDVAHDAQRPFRVFAGAAVVRAVGTQFNVHRTQSGTTVAVVEGVVELTSRSAVDPRGQSQGTQAIERPERLLAGEQAQVSAQGAMLQHTATEIERIVAWRERRLIFRSEPLASIVAEFNRYNETQLVIDGAVTRTRLVTGVFDADNPHALVAFLERDPQLSVQTRGNKVLIRGP